MVINVFVLFYILSVNINITVNITAINNAMVINIEKFCILEVAFFSLKFVGTVFVSSSHDLTSTSKLYQR